MIEVDNSLFKAITPTVAVGEVIKLVVRQEGQPNGQGTVGFRGQAIKATLPPNLKSGDEILAKVGRGPQDSIVLKILDLQRGDQTSQSQGVPSGTATVAAKLADELRSLVDTPEGFLNFKAQAPPTEGQTAPAGQPALPSKELAQSLKTLAEGTDLKNPQTALSQLIAATTGDVAESLRDAATAIRQLADQSSPPGEKFATSLRTGLNELLQTLKSPFKDGGGDPAARLTNIVKTIREELKSNNDLPPHTRAMLENVERELSSPGAKKESIESKVENALKTIERQFTTDRGTTRVDRDNSNPAELTRLAQRLDQLASTQETLQQLNPLMHALGEPALVLLPFLSQGLLNHSEVTIDPNARRKNKGGGQGKGDGEGDGEDRGDSTPYQRVQVSVPMPSLGVIDVDIAHRRDELLVRITVENDEAEKFISGQIEDLNATLRTLGFKRSEIVAAVGEHSDSMPVWCEALSSRMSVRA